MKTLHSLLRLLLLFGWMMIAGSGVAQTVPTWISVGPPGGSLTSILADPLVPKTTVYVGSDSNGVFVSSDVGGTWRSANNGIASSATGQRQVYALAALGNNVYAATNTGVYMSAGGGTPAWSLVTSPLAPTSTSVINLMRRVNATLYLAVSGEPSLYFTSVSGASPAWSQASALPVPLGQNESPITALGVMGGGIAVGSVGAVFTQDESGNWVNSETLNDTTSMLAGDSVATVISSPSRWAFACTLAGTVFKKDLSFGANGFWMPLAWDLTGTFAAPVSDTCHGLSIARLSSDGRSVLVVATPTGAFVSDIFDESSYAPASLVPGPKFPAMTSSVNGALQLDTPALSTVLWATEFGLYSSAVSGVDSLLASKGPASAMSGPAKIASPSQRLDNVNVYDVAVLGSTLYAIAASAFNSYADVMSSADGGATWSRVGLTTQFVHLQAIRSIVADKVHSVLYAGTDQGVFAYSPSSASWSAVGGSYDVSALAVGAQALYSGRRSSASAVPNSALVIQPLVGGTSFLPVEVSPGDHFNVRSVVVSGGSVYVGGGSSQDPTDTDAGPYNNAVYVAPDFNPANPSSPAGWRMATSDLFPNGSMLSTMEIAGSELFIGGYGFLMRSHIGAGSWGPVIGLPVLNSGDTVSVSALASDGQSLFVGTSGQGLFALSLATNTSSLVAVNGNGAAGLPSLLVNGMRYLDGNIYVATTAGITRDAKTSNTATSEATGGGGGCSIAMVGKPDPMLWLLVLIAALQIIAARYRRNPMAQWLGVRQQTEDGASQ